MTAAEVLGPIGSLGDHAVEYARGGFEVFPVNPQTKTPYGAYAIVGSQYDATTDVELVERCWHQHPDALIGHRIGDGVLLTDIDPRHGGHDTWRELQAVHGTRPSTRIHVSGRGDGGGHLWWHVDLEQGETFNVGRLTAWAREHEVGHPITVDGAATERWSSGIDLLHRRHRYTILPPSPHPDTGKPYRWGNGRDADVAPIPPWLRALVVVHKAPAPTPAPSTADSDSIIEWFDRTRRFADVLAGWTLIKGSGDDNGSLWRHPTATAEHSASVRDGCLYVHSPNTPFEPTEPGSPHGYDAFDCYAVLQHHGDRSTAARAARELKDGVRPPLVELEQLIANEGAVERGEEPATPGALLEHGWHRTDLAEILAEDYVAPAPALLLRTDGDALFYPGRVNGLNGESGSGKSWVATAAVAELLHAGRNVVYVDFEDHAASLVARLTALGAPIDAIVGHFTYIQPEGRYTALAAAHVEALVRDNAVDLVVIDSVGEAMALDGQKQNDDDEVAGWFRRLPRRLAALGPAVILVDHVPKAKDAPALFAIGSQRKRAAIDGASYRVEQTKALGRGRSGIVKLTCAKDRNGHYPTGNVVAHFHLDATGEPTVVTVRAPEVLADGEEFRPTHLMQKVSELLEQTPDLSGNQIEVSKLGKATYVRAAIKALVADHHVLCTPRGAGFSYRVITPFRDTEPLPPVAPEEEF